MVGLTTEFRAHVSPDQWQNLGELGERAEAEWRDATRDATETVADWLRYTTPYSGVTEPGHEHLRDHIATAQERLLGGHYRGIVYFDTPEMDERAGFVIEGTRAHDIPRQPDTRADPKTLRFFWRGSLRFYRRVWHPGTRANPFLDRAGLLAEAEVRARYDRAFAAIFGTEGSP